MRSVRDRRFTSRARQKEMAEDEKEEAGVGDEAEGAIINAGHVVKLRALEAIATFPVEGRTLNYKH